MVLAAAHSHFPVHAVRLWLGALLIASSLGFLGTTPSRAQNPLAPAAASHPFAGTFGNERVRLDLTFDAAQSAYTGWLTVATTRYAIGGFDDNGTLAGKFVVDGQQFGFSASLDADTLTLVSDGKTHKLLRKMEDGEPHAPAAQTPLPGHAGPAAGGQPGQPRAESPGAPVGLEPGLRVTYYMGSASIPGARTVLSQDDKGNWIDPATGRRYAEADNPGSAGAGYYQLNVVAADDRAIAVDARNYLLIDPQNDRTLLSTATAYLGTPEGLGDFWQPPAKLAAMADGDSGGTRIRRMVYPVNNRNYNAVTITTTSGANYIRNVYDLESGLLIAASSSSIGSATMTPNPNGTSSVGAGATMITSTRILDVRKLEIPWAGQPLPAWAAAGKRLTYAGQYATLMQGAPVIPWKLDVTLDITRAHPAWVGVKQNSRLDTGMGGPPQDSPSDRVSGTTMIDPIWINPQTLARLRPNTVIDEDRITKRRVTFVGAQGNVALLTDQGPFDGTQYAYDLRSGVLVGIQTQQQQGPATIQTQLQLQNPP